MQNKKNISERRDKTYILSYIYNTFVVRHKGVIKGVGGGGLISGWVYIRNIIFVSKWMGLYLGGGGGL